MLDGQNLFDDTTSFYGEWEVDESIIKLTSSLKPVVIGIDHGGSERINELTPYPHDKYGGGDAYLLLEWITNQLMPFIRSKYGLQINPEHCAIAGSSLGGLFSHYAILKRPDLFRYAGVFSPSYWYNKDVYQETNSQIATAKRFMYLSAGDNEDETMIPNLKKMVDILNKHPNISLETKTIVDGEHNEKQWKTSFPEFLNWWIYNLSD
jgi:predicted alpha/beta superfamily hydrolase